MKIEEWEVGHNPTGSSTQSIIESSHANTRRSDGHEDAASALPHASVEWLSSLELAKRFHLPNLEMATFDGDVGRYRCFMRAFNSNIVSKVNNEEEKLHYLYQYTVGRPRDIVATCLHLPPERGFVEALSLLDHRYGSPVQVAAGLVDKLLAYPSVKADDVEGLETFAIHLRGSMNSLASLPHGAGSVDVKTIRLLLNKVPPFMKDKWRNKVDEIEQSHLRPAEFMDFVQYIEREARIASNPSYGRHVTTQSETRAVFRERRLESGSNMRGKILASTLSSPNVECLYCKQNHGVAECPKLEMKTRDEKLDFVYSNRLCFGCLQANHIAKHCPEKKTCNICRGAHPTVLHFNRQEPLTPAVTSGHLAAGGGAKLQVVPVRVSLFGITTLTNAFLDSGSTHSFASRHLLEILRVHPQGHTSITLSTINADQKLDTCIVSHVIIEDMECNNRLELPPLFVLNRIPVSSDDGPSPDDVNKWQYLLDGGVHIEEKVHGEVGLLGNNVAATTEPLDVIPGQNGGPFALRTTPFVARIRRVFAHFITCAFVVATPQT